MARALLFEHLQKKAGATATMPTFPREKLILWISQQQQSVAPDEKARYLFLSEQLLVAQSLLGERDEKLRAQGLLVASESANYAGATLPKDTFLLARIYEGFLLPYISLASVERWRDPSRQRIIESASGVFAHAGEPDKQKKMLEWLLALGEAKPNPKHPNATQLDPNTLDWTRGTLAVLLSKPKDAPAADLRRALALFQSIQSPTMSGFEHIEKQLQTRVDKLPKAPKATTASTPAL